MLSIGKWEKIGITVLIGVAKFVGPRTVEVAAASGAPTHVTGEHVLIATGGVPLLPAGIPGVDLPGVITSDGFFDLESQPKKCAVIGAGVESSTGGGLRAGLILSLCAGYIAVEMAGILHSLGTETTIFCRGDSVRPALCPSITDPPPRPPILTHPPFNDRCLLSDQERQRTRSTMVPPPPPPPPQVLRSESFERDIVTALTALMKGHGPTVQPNSSIASISATDKLLTLTMKDKTCLPLVPSVNPLSAPDGAPALVISAG
eukprot:SAG11_NODE_116_length_16002_cov_19.164560_14_plen_261_part_00